MTAHRSRRRLLALAAALLVFTSSTAAHAEGGGPAGAVAILDTTGGQPVAGGNGHDPFTVELPKGASCPGDSLNNYRVQSFLVPAGADPGTLVYQGVRPGEPDGSARYWALYKVNSDTYMNQPTNRADKAGGEGVIINIPSFSFAVFDPGMVPAGRAHLGIACSLFGKTVRYWSTDVDVVVDAKDPAGIAWTVVDPPARTSNDGGSSVGLVAGAVAVAAAGAFLVLRRRTRARTGVPS